MTDQQNWQCPTCGERHEGQFETCWKCGSNQTGSRNQDFHVSEPVSENDQLLDSEDDVQLPTLQLPGITYFSIPPLIWISVVCTFIDFERNPIVPGIPKSSVSKVEIVVLVFVFALIGIPILFTMTRFLFLCLIRRLQMLKNFPLLWMLTMFRLPVNLCRNHSWFVPVYYGSLVALFILEFGRAAWHFARTI